MAETHDTFSSALSKASQILTDQDREILRREQVLVTVPELQDGTSQNEEHVHMENLNKVHFNLSKNKNENKPLSALERAAEHFHSEQAAMNYINH